MASLTSSCATRTDQMRAENAQLKAKIKTKLKDLHKLNEKRIKLRANSVTEALHKESRQYNRPTQLSNTDVKSTDKKSILVELTNSLRDLQKEEKMLNKRVTVALKRDDKVI
jgi:hypothetical protein